MASKQKSTHWQVWIDMEKAFDKVCENGLRLKLQQSEGLHVPFDLAVPDKPKS